MSEGKAGKSSPQRGLGRGYKIPESLTCPTCGCPVTVYSTDEGTSSYERLPDPRLAVAEEMAEALRRIRLLAADPDPANPNEIPDLARAALAKWDGVGDG